MSNLPRYVRKITYSDGSARYVYNPPKKYVDLKLAAREGYTKDLQEMCRIVEVHNAKIDAWKRLYNRGKPLHPNSTIHQLVAHYQQSPSYQRLRHLASKEYNSIFPFLKQELSYKKIGKLSVSDAKCEYEKWLARGTYQANKVLSVASVIFNFAIDMGYIPMNPFSRVRKQKPKPRVTIWTDEQVRRFLDVAYADFKWRNFGLIVQMTYMWVQKVGDMRLLTWDSIDWCKQTVTIKQSSHKATVILPIEDSLFAMLKQQYDEFGFQPYVAPKTRPRVGKYHAYHMQNMGHVTRRILEAAGLPLNLRISDLRRTGTVQMLEGNVPIPYVMLVTGHKTDGQIVNLAKNSAENASEALNKRVY